MANSTFQFKIVTPEGKVYEDTVERVTLPTAAGEITVLKKHTPLVTKVVPGRLVTEHDGRTDSLAIADGFLEVRESGEVVLLADTAQKSEEIDAAEAKDAMQRAKENLNEGELSEVEYEKMNARMQWEQARVRAASR